MNKLPFDYYVDADIQKAESLPTNAFTDKEFLDLELKTIFRKNWLFVPLKTQSELRQDPRTLHEMLQLRGAHSPFFLGQHPLFLQRDWKGILHCFPNICTHAWFPLIQGPGREKVLTCQQHGRKFDCDGTYVSHLGFSSDLPCFPREEEHLKEIQVKEWNPFFFLSLEEPEIPFEELLRPIKESFSSLSLEDWKRMPQAKEEREVEGNWKQHAWNYMDNFHVTFIHRAPGGLADAVEMSSYQTELFPYSSLQWVYAKDPAHGFDPKLLAPRFRDPAHPEKRVFALWWFIFPNLTLNFYPWGLSINIYSPLPEDPSKTLFFWYHYILDEEKYEKRDEIWMNLPVDVEDVDAMTQIQRNLISDLGVRGRFAPEREKGPHWFHHLISSILHPES